MTGNSRLALAGLEAGVSGSLAMLGWLGMASLFFHRSVWWVPNLFAGVFYGDASLKYGFGRYTVAGISLELFLYGCIGAGFGLFWRERPGGLRVLGFALLISIAAYYLLIRVAWKSLSPAASLYGPDRQILIGHLLYALLLSRFPRYRDAL
ncbi:MAG: hypothetical protein M3Z09_02390 [Acidobacteriota bacterium]|nr:hypothetical protein [Acidobacteriota bacterium]